MTLSSLRIRKSSHNHFCTFIGGPNTVEFFTKKGSKISWHCPFKKSFISVFIHSQKENPWLLLVHYLQIKQLLISVFIHYLRIKEPLISVFIHYLRIKEPLISVFIRLSSWQGQSFLKYNCGNKTMFTIN